MGGANSSVDATQQRPQQASRKISTRSKAADSKVNADNERVSRLVQAMTAHPRKRRQGAWTTQAADEGFDGYKESVYILKQLYKKMDPAVMKTLGDAKGEVKLSLKYDQHRQLLMVKVIGARDLSAKDLRGKESDPYVKLDLIPDNSTNGFKMTNYVNHSLNPTYNEIFTFSLADEDIPTSLLRIQVLSHDQLGKDDFMGEKIIELGQIDWSEITTRWFELEAETDLDIRGELEISLSYKLPETLQVSIHRATELACREKNKLPDPYIKIIIPGIPKVEETKVQKGSREPEWEEIFEYNVPREELPDRYIVLHVLDKAFLGNTESLGQVYIDLTNLDINEGYTGKFPLADLKNSDRVRTKWAQTATVQEFREAMYAHAVYKCPKLIFQNHQGNKVLTVHSRKAGSSAKIRILNGVAT
ncbi:double C2-like domain-containing protein beta [Patiria miniata]|uniref:C2 domain-containing protein n=1 Tax=Patiria miniata TaxID=46514 RepID=A0A913ZT42_PATMI|nr:double C2-like domain-containing protein beta [Patiria miniata]